MRILHGRLYLMKQYIEYQEIMGILITKEDTVMYRAKECCRSIASEVDGKREVFVRASNIPSLRK